MVNIFILVISRYDYNAGYQIKIKSISRLTEDKKKQAEISISKKGVSSSDRMQTIEKNCSSGCILEKQTFCILDCVWKQNFEIDISVFLTFLLTQK